MTRRGNVRLHDRDLALAEAGGGVCPNEQRTAEPAGGHQRRGRRKRARGLPQTSANADAPGSLRQGRGAEGEEKRDPIHTREGRHLNESRVAVLRVPEECPRLPDNAATRQFRRDPEGRDQYAAMTAPPRAQHGGASGGEDTPG